MIRDTDIIARYGGDEFAFIFPETTKQSARRLIERIRKTIKENPIKLSRGLTVSLTLSVGISTYPRDADTDWELLNVADKSLYLSKKNGRDRLTLFVPSHYVIFSYKPEYPVKHVSVVGSFNGWDPKADPLQKQDNGTFTTRTHLAPGTYQYKYLINGNHWTQDPKTSESTYDGFKGQNSIITIPS